MLQVVHHLPMFTLYFPTNVLAMFSYIGLVNLENPYFQDIYYLHINKKKIHSRGALDYRFNNQGYQTTSILLNCSDLFVYLILLIIYYSVILLLAKIIKYNQNREDNENKHKIRHKLVSYLHKEKRNLWLNTIIRILIEIYLE